MGCVGDYHLGHGGDIGKHLSPPDVHRQVSESFLPKTMENDTEFDALSDIRKHFRAVSFTPATEFINIDLRNDPVPKEDRHKDRVVHESEVLLAGILVEEACKGGNGYFQTSPKELRSYKIYNKPGIIYFVYLFVCLDLSLALFEEPAVPGLAMPYWATLILEYFCLLVFTLRLFHVWSFAAGVKFWKDKKNLILLLIIVLTFLDMIMYVIFQEANLKAHAIRWTRVLRPLFLINLSEGRQIRRAVRNIRRTLPEIVNVLILLLLMIALFSLMGVKLFGRKGIKDVHGKPYFSNYIDVYFSLYVLTTTANNPDVGMPAYDYNPWSALFFVVFVVICMYIFVSIFLAVVYKNYRKHLKNEIRKTVYRKRRQLKQAFDVLKIWDNNTWKVTEERFIELMNEIRPGWSKARLALLWQVLDDNGGGMIGKKNFLMIADLLNVEVLEVSDQVHFLERVMPKIYLSYVSNKLKQMVCHRYFAYFFDLVIFANAIFIALDSNDLEVLFLAIFNVEILLKFYTFGFKEFFRSFWNWFDFLVIGAATIALIVESSYSSLQSSQGVLDLLMVLRVLRLVKIIGNVKRFQVIIGTLMQIGPAISIYGTIMFILYYVYAIMGMEIFAGLVKMHGYTSPDGNSSVKLNVTNMFCGNRKLEGSDFHAEHYCNNNFNDILKSLKILFDLTVVNQWHVITQGFVLVTDTAARIYFMSFHLICVIVVLNIFVAFILEAFMLEYSFTHGKFAAAFEKKIEEKGVGVGSSPIKERAESTTRPLDRDFFEDDNSVETSSKAKFKSTLSLEESAFDSGLRFCLPKQQKKNAETLLQQMFESELLEDDMGPKVDDLDDLDDLAEEQEFRREKRLEFATVDRDSIQNQ